MKVISLLLLVWMPIMVSAQKPNDDNQKYQALISPIENRLKALSIEQSNLDLKKDTVLLKDLRARFTKTLREERAAKIQFIKANPDSPISLDLVNEMIKANAGMNIDLSIVEPLYKSLSDKLHNTALGKEIAVVLNTVRLTSIGQLAPDFSEIDVNGKLLNLKDFRGKYVLLDFWASWCVPCRAENPNYVAAYQQYKNKNFTMLGISLDQQSGKEAWMAAIKKDGLEWQQVADLSQKIAKQYGIKLIPQNYLIDPSGKILARNLRGEALKRKLAELLPIN